MNVHAFTARRDPDAPGSPPPGASAPDLLARVASGGRTPHRPPNRQRDRARLKEVVESVRTLGFCFTVVGVGCVLWAFMETDGLGPRRIATLSIAFTLLVAPGVLYVLAGNFLRNRRYRAWVATYALTIVLLVCHAFLCGVIGWQTFRRPVWRLNELVGPVLFFAAWGGALLVILGSLRECMPMVREAEEAAVQGFHVLPVARHAPDGNNAAPPDDERRGAGVRPVGSANPTSPSPAPPAPSPPPPPPPA
jgi:hypothetical protein